MNILQDENLSPADQQAIDQLRPVVEQLTPAARRKLLAFLARKSLPAEGGNVMLSSEDGDVFAYLYSAKRPVYDFSNRFTKDQLAAIERNLFDPKNSMTLEEFLSHVEAEDDRKTRPR